MNDLDLAVWGLWIRQHWGVEPRQAVRARPGFSGADVFRITTDAGSCALRRWPQADPDRLTWIHACQTLAARSCDFVPRLMPTASGGTWVRHQERLWELATWQPGLADFHQRPTPARLVAAMRGLARLHAAWSVPTDAGPCPAACRRRARLLDWSASTDEQLRQVLARWPNAEQVDLARRAAAVLQARRAEALKNLEPWCRRVVRLQVCLADVWHDHALFSGDELTGLVDFGGVRWDHSAVDVGRLLGSLVGNDAQAWSVGLAAYTDAGALARSDLPLPRLLHHTGQLAALATWLRLLVLERRDLAAPDAAWNHFADLVRQLAAGPIALP